MAYPPDRAPYAGAYDPVAPTDYPSTAVPPATSGYNYGTTEGHFGPSEPAYRRGRDLRAAGTEVREDLTREVTAGPFRFGLKEGVLGILGIFAILGLVLGILGFAAAFALDNAADRLSDGNDNNDAGAAAELLPAVLVSMLPFMAAPVLAIGAGAWAGHSARDGTIGSVAGGIGSFLGPILMLLITGVGFALGAGAAGLDLSNVRVLEGWGIAPGWNSTIPYLFTGAGLLWLLACLLGGALTGGVVGALLNRRWAARNEYRRTRYTNRGMRY